MVNFHWAYRTNEVINLTWIRSSQNHADNFISSKIPCFLRRKMQVGVHYFFVDQRIFKENYKMTSTTV